MSQVQDDARWDRQRLALEQELSHPFIAMWHALPRRSSSALIRTLRGHIGSVNGCEYSPDGKWIVSASLDRTLKVWEATSGAEHLALSGHTGPVLAYGYSPDGKWIVSASSDYTLKVWEVQLGQCVLTYPVDEALFDCAFHPDELHLVACGQLGMYFLRLVS